MPRVIRKLKQALKRLVPTVYRRNYNCNMSISERQRRGRQEFFYNAFKALSFNGIDGDYVEFGCCGGMTFALAYHEATKHGHKAKLWAFDSFQGLPAPKEAKDSHPKWVEHKMSTTLEQFHKLCAANQVPRDAYNVIPGFYDKTLPAMSCTDGPKDIALAYIDCDLYSSTKDVLEFLTPRLKHGMIIAFDDYFCWSATQNLWRENGDVGEVLGEQRMETFPIHAVWLARAFLRRRRQETYCTYLR